MIDRGEVELTNSIFGIEKDRRNSPSGQSTGRRVT